MHPPGNLARAPPASTAAFSMSAFQPRTQEKRMTENVAEKIRESLAGEDREPQGGIIALSGEALRLRRELAVAQKWIEAARDGNETGHLALTAEYTRDALEEQLSRTAFQMEVLRSQREWREAREAVENVDEAARAAVLSDALLTVYCILRDVPDGAFGGESPGRERYTHMGALMAAQEAANAEMDRFSGKRPA